MEEVGRSGMFAFVSDDERLVQPLKVPKEFTGRLALFTDHRPRKGRVWIAVRSGVAGDSLVASKAPRVRGAGDVVELSIALPQNLAGRTVAIEVATRGVSPDQPVRLWVDERDEKGDTNAHLLRVGKGRSLRDGRRPFALSSQLLTPRPRWEALSPNIGRTVATGASIVGVGALLSVAVFLLRRTAHLFTRFNSRWGRIAIVCGLLIAGAAARWWFAVQHPLVNDEQSYVYNGVTWNIHQPYFWKSPVLIGLVGLAHQLRPFTDPLQPRLLIIAAGLFSTVLLARVARQLVGPSAALGVLLIGFLAPAPAAHSVLVLTEQLMAVPILLGIICILRARQQTPAPFSLLVIASGLLGLGVLTRWSAIFWFLQGALLLRTRSPREFFRRAATLVSVPVFLGLAASALVPEAVYGARILVELLQEFIERSRGSVLQKISRWRRIFGDFVPLLTLAGLAYPGRTSRGRVTGTIVAGGIAAAFFFPYLSGEWRSAYAWVPAVVGSVPLAIWILGRGFPGGLRGTQTLEVVSFLIPPALAYAVFYKTNEKYAAEFLPGLVLLAGVGFGRVLEALFTKLRPESPSVSPWGSTERLAARAAVVAGLILILTAAWYPVLHARPYAGTLAMHAVRESITAVRSLTAPDDQVLAAAVLIPLFADRSVPGRLAHPSADQPTWRGRPNPGYHGHFGPLADMLERGDIAAVVTEKLFDDTYGRYPRIPSALEAKYRLEREIGSGNGTPIRVYLRRAR
ncbi:MAG: hypothetical protein G01um101438_565 [Parcubacteria group bacterium Gr01-1014_38]|nr:MAG: hypothetical protein G01um101438_565 [Parcubacteria group bacterium Gr01-1014_38]